MDSNQVEASMTQTRPSTAGLIELHVYFVPEDLWNSKLNKVSTDVINKFISVGFIRVSPEMRLRTLRERLGEFLGDDAVIERFVFLKSVGRSLAVVKAKQEQELKLKAFVPPYAIQPELYLLPGADNEGSTYGSSITPEEHQYIPEYIGIDGSGPRRLNIPERDQTLHNEQKLPLHIDREQTLHPEPTHSIQLDRDQTLHTERSQPLYTERDRPLVKETLYSEKVPPLQTDALNKENTKNSPIYSHEENIAEPFKWTSKEQEVVPIENPAQYHTQVQQQEEHLSPRRKEKISISNLKQKENENVSKENKRLPGRNTARDSGIPESLGGRETEHPQRKRKELKSKNTVKSQTGRYNDQFGDNSPRDLPEPAQYLSPPPPPPVPAFPTINSPTSKSQSHRESVVEQLNRLKEERLQLEKSREELVKKTKSLLEQYKLRRYQARDSWKKKYFETKKATSVLEETLNKLRTDLEMYYQKLLTQLAARDSKKRIKYPTLAGSTKNAAIMQITKKQHEIDQLKRKLENARTKLMIEIKMRKQASSDLNVLKAELAQKKAQAVLTLTPVFAL